MHTICYIIYLSLTLVSVMVSLLVVVLVMVSVLVLVLPPVSVKQILLSRKTQTCGKASFWNAKSGAGEESLAVTVAHPKSAKWVLSNGHLFH